LETNNSFFSFFTIWIFFTFEIIPSLIKVNFMKNKKLQKEYMYKYNSKYMSILFIGHFAIDNIIRFNTPHTPSLGGSVTFGSLALRKYTRYVNIGIISNVGKFDFSNSFLNKIKKTNINLDGLKWFNSLNTNFVLNYSNHSRILTLKSKSPNLNFNDIPDFYRLNKPDIIILAPLCNEISYDYVSKIVLEFPNAYIGIDLQGFIRDISQSGDVSYISNTELIEKFNRIIDLIDDRLILKGSEIEMKLLTGKDDLEEVMEYFHKFNNRGIYIMTLGENGSMIKKKDAPTIKIPAFSPRKVVDETGAGDVYLAIFLFEFLTSDRSWNEIKKSGYLASAAASYLVEKNGPAGFQKKNKVLKRVNNKNYTN
jgi:sugar/nucleoside kinase (ribokinase family)